MFLLRCHVFPKKIFKFDKERESGRDKRDTIWCCLYIYVTYEWRQRRRSEVDVGCLALIVGVWEEMLREIYGFIGETWCRFRMNESFLYVHKCWPHVFRVKLKVLYTKFLEEKCLSEKDKMKLFQIRILLWETYSKHTFRGNFILKGKKLLLLSFLWLSFVCATTVNLYFFERGEIKKCCRR